MPEDRKRLFLHYPAGKRIYVMVVVNWTQCFDFSDNTIKPADMCRHLSDATLPIAGSYDERAYHSCSYVFEFDFRLFAAGKDSTKDPVADFFVCLLVHSGWRGT